LLYSIEMEATARIDAESLRDELFGDLAIQRDHLLALRRRLDNDFDVAASGFAQLSDITDDRDRGVISDQIRASASSVLDNLLEARLAEARVSDLLKDERRMPTAETVKASIRTTAEIDREIAGWSQSLSSAFDCMTAAAIGIARIPLSITKAQLSHLHTNVPQAIPTATPRQQQAWQEMLDLLDVHRASYPEGWFEWLTGMRVLSTHRARQTRIFVQKTRDDDQEPPLIILSSNPEEINRAAATFEFRLRRRPQVPDMQDLIDVRLAHKLWINEPATTTLPGVSLVVNELLEEWAEHLLATWQKAGDHPQDFPVPTSSWAPERQLPTGFAGVAPLTKVFRARGGEIHLHPTLQKRLELAERLSARRQR
jgi:hypothetical protein